MRLIDLVAEPTSPVFHIFAVIAVKILNMAIALESENVGSDPVQKPSVVANNDSTSGKVLKRLFQRPHRIYIEVVCRFVKQNDIGSAFEHFGKMHSITFAARKLPDPLLLV